MIKSKLYLPILGLALTLSLLRLPRFQPAAPGPAFALLEAQLLSPPALLAALVGVLAAMQISRKAIAPRGQFEAVFGPDWEREAGARKRPLLPLGQSRPRLVSGTVFWTLPGTHFELLADLWQPPVGVQPSGLALIYFQCARRGPLARGFGSPALFRRLAARGHVVMAVPEQRYIEVDWSGRVADVHRATAWMKANSARLGVDPGQIVLAGDDAGADIALLAAFAPEHHGLIPPDTEDEDASVAAALAYYSPAAAATPRSGLFSPLTHAGKGCPPALVLHCDEALTAPGSPAVRLLRSGAPVVCAAYRRGGHGLDLLVPGLSVSHRSMMEAVERFLEALASSS